MHKTQKRSNIIKKTAIIDKIMPYLVADCQLKKLPGYLDTKTYDIMYWGLMRLTIKELNTLYQIVKD